MKDRIVDRVLTVSNLIVENDLTIRQIANRMKLSKSTIHTDLSIRLPEINNELYLEVNDILKKHWEEKHVRGGNATKLKYKITNKLETN